MAHCEVLVVGAGPTGLVLALCLAKLGVDLRIIDKAAGPGTTSRALAVQARTLELYRQLELAETIVQQGHKVPAVNFWTKGRPAARLPFETIGSGLTPFSFLEIFPQDQHERLLIERLNTLGHRVAWQTELTGYEDHGDHVTAHVRHPDGAEDVWQASTIAGCDGAHSTVRHGIGEGFPGGTYRQVFYVADVEASGPAINGELHVDLDQADFLAVFPLAQRTRARLIGTVRDERAEHADQLRFDDVSGRAIRNLGLQVETVNWFSTYHVHHRVAEHFRKGRAFLLGDAAHIHSPAGGQGMNTGIGDAINLSWKLHAALAGFAPDRLLDSYEDERIGFARRLVATTDRVFTFATAEGPIADILRTRVAPLLIPPLAEFEVAREYIFRTVSQISLNYRSSPLSRGAAGRVHGGDRLPWVAVDDNFATPSPLTWQVHVYGTVRDDLSTWCSTHRVPLRVFEWRPETEAAGLARNALYLLRPDTYVALADSTGAPEALDRYGADQGIRFGSPSVPH